MDQVSRMRVERNLEIALTALWRAACAAELAPDQGYADDLHQIRDECRRIQNDLAHNRPRPSTPLT